MSKIGIGLIGSGFARSTQAPAFRLYPDAALVAVCSGRFENAKNMAEEFAIPHACASYEELISLEEVSLVVISAPPNLHHSAAIAALAAGKHVICEKPMALNAKQGQEMVDACKKANVKLLVGYRMHFEPKTLEVIRMRNAGEFGKVLFFQGLSGFTIGDPTQWRLNKELAGGGAMMDIGIYSVNGARYMIGEDPVWVTAQETKNDPVKFKEGVDETIQFQLGFPGGAVASCLSTYSMNNLDRFFLNGTQGFAEMMPSTGYGPIMGRTHKGELTQPVVTHQTVQMDEMSAIIFQGKQPVVPVDGEEGVKDLKIIDAIYEACKTGKKIELKL